MPLPPGTRLGPYEVTAPLGAGGMGEVYRARDAKLGREVAIKVLPEEFTQHPQKLARFEREARLLAALNHPGIATLHGLEESEGSPFLVMELVEGDTLAERIARGPLPVDEALTASLQIAQALEAAHEKGVIHRDLKPANIKVDPEGQVKVLDFGLAKAFAEDTPEGDSSFSPTLSREATQAGVILGTAAYMSPEQAKGKVVDKRTDIFSFGVVLFEMLTGKKAFAGEDVSDVLASIMKLEPDWKAVPPDLDPRIQSLLRRCLKKDRKKRLQAIGDVRVEIEEILADPGDASVQQPLAVPASSRAREKVAWGLVATLVASVVVWSVTRPGPRPPTRFAVTLPPGDQLMLGTSGSTLSGGIALSPDGRDLVYVGNREGITELYRRSMNQLEAVPIRGTEGAAYPFFSPDGEWVGFFADNKLKKVSLAGGPPVTLCDAGMRAGASWGPDDVIIFASDPSRGLMQVSATGGAPEPVTTLETGEVSLHRWPDILPGGHAVLFTVHPGGLADARIAVHSLETGERQVLMDGSHPRYAPTGHIVFGRANSLWAVPFDSDRLEVTGAPTPVLEGVQVSAIAGLANFALASDGSLVYVPSGAEARRTFVWVDREGREEPVAVEPQAYEEFTLSPDGTQLAVRIAADNSDLWIYDLVRNTRTRLTFDPATEYSPVWTPNGQRVAFGGPTFPLSWKAADGTGEVEPLVENSSNLRPQAFSPDGTALVFMDPSSGRDLGILSLEGERASTLLWNTEFPERNAALSPDGRWIAYESNESGQVEIYVRPFPDVDAGRWQVSNDGGTWPLWAPEGRELFYVGPQDMVVVAIETEPTFTLGTRESLFDTAPYTRLLVRRVAVAPDGQRFLMTKMSGGSEDTTAPPSIVVVQNWFEELKRLVPTN